jgi:uncharacterized membrane-anchored protein YitT (DUF2179 family)
MASPLQTLEVPADALRHSVLEDAQGLAIGVLFCGLGVTLLAHLGFLTGQTAGLALLISYGLGLPFGWVFLVVNLPFYAFALGRLGWRFTVKSLACVAGLSLAAETIPRLMPLGEVNPAFGMIVFGAMTGIGLLAIFRHGGSLGGLGMVALWVQDSTGFRAGYVQLIFDAVLFAVALVLFPWTMVAWSVAGAVVLNGVIAINHRRDRYIAR